MSDFRYRHSSMDMHEKQYRQSKIMADMPEGAALTRDPLSKPRLRGDNDHIVNLTGPPPLTRGTRSHIIPCDSLVRITPADAGNTLIRHSHMGHPHGSGEMITGKCHHQRHKAPDHSHRSGNAPTVLPTARSCLRFAAGESPHSLPAGGHVARGQPGVAVGVGVGFLEDGGGEASGSSSRLVGNGVNLG